LDSKIRHYLFKDDYNSIHQDVQTPGLKYFSKWELFLGWVLHRSFLRNERGYVRKAVPGAELKRGDDSLETQRGENSMEAAELKILRPLRFK
jgi:hypothetical protein